MRAKRLLTGLLIILVLTSQITPVYALDGVLSPVTTGTGGGNWAAVPRVDTLLRLSIVRQKKETYAKFGFKDSYPDNGGYSLILGGRGNNKTSNIGLFSGGSLGYINSSGIVFFNDDWLGNNTRNVGTMFHAALMYDVDVYKGEGTSRLMSSREIQWTQWVGHDVLQSANRGSTPLPSVTEMTNRISFGRVMDQTSENMKPMANAMVCLGAFLNAERGANFDLGDIWNYYVGRQSNFEYLLMLENLHYFSQNGVGFYVHQNQMIAAVAGRSVRLDEYKGDTLNFLSNIIGANNFNTINSTRIRKGGHTSTINLIFDYLFDPNLYMNGHARNTYYSRNERIVDGQRIWGAEFESTGPVLTDYSRAKTGFAIYNENLPAVTLIVPDNVEGRHRLTSVQSAIEADLNERVRAEQFIDWQQEEAVIDRMAEVIEQRLVNAANQNFGWASLQFDRVEYTITELPSDHKGGFSIINENMPMSFSLSYNANAPPPNPSIRSRIVTALRSQLSDKRNWPVSAEESVFDTPGVYVWRYGSTAQFVYRINSVRETIDLNNSQAQTNIRLRTSSSEQLRWQNTPLAFAEVKEGTFSDARTSERWEAMNGVPTTETLYINAGGTPVYIDIIASYNTESFFKQYSGTDTTTCPGHSTGGMYPTTYYCTTGSDSAQEEVGHISSFVTITGITFRTADRAVLESTKLFLNGREEVPINGAVSVVLDSSSRKYTKSLGLPATNNYGFTTAETSRHANTSGTCRAPNGQIALNQAKSTDSAQAFAQSDRITIQIEGVTYQIVDGRIVQSAANASSNNDTTRDSFIPLRENWNITTRIPFIAYVGQPRAAGARNISSPANSNKLRFYKTGVRIPLNQVNGLYTFEPMEQVMVYGPARVLIGENSGSVPVNVTGFAAGGGCTVLVDYVNYLQTGAPHALTDVDGPGPNPIILHNPVSAQDIWVFDIPDATLQDQRINKNTFTNTRSYIDYSFRLTIPNRGSFEFNEAGTKRADLLEHSLLRVHRTPGVLGKSFTGTYNTAFNALPRGTSYPSSIPNSANLNTDRWVRAKYVRLPFNAYYTSTHPGAATGFHNANTWITLYDQGRDAAVANDPTEFTFYITSDVPDTRGAVITYLAEAINAPANLAGNPAALAADAEKNANTLRTVEGVYRDLENDVVAHLSARHSAVYTTTQDVIGRIGNVIVDDSNDPRWANVFWPQGSRWLIENLVRVPLFQPGGRFYSLYFNMFEEQSVGAAFNNRWGTLSEYHPGNLRQGSIPVTSGSNPQQGLTYSAVKMGYAVQFNVQTLGSYGDGTLRITPKYLYVNPSRSVSTENISMFINESGTYREFYKASRQTNADTAKAYNPAVNFTLSHTLRDERAKINTAERQTPSFVSATATNRINLGTPSYIEIPPTLRTFIGGTATTGTTGIGTSHAGNTSNADGSFRNAHRWHGRLALPSSTVITPEGSTNLYDLRGGYLITYLKIETSNSAAPWELEITTNTAGNANGHPRIITGITPYGRTAVTIQTPTDNPVPRIPVIVFDAGNTSSGDTNIIGTH
jgi:hypothetical protein